MKKKKHFSIIFTSLGSGQHCNQYIMVRVCRLFSLLILFCDSI